MRWLPPANFWKTIPAHVELHVSNANARLAPAPLPIRTEQGERRLFMNCSLARDRRGQKGWQREREKKGKEVGRRMRVLINDQGLVAVWRHGPRSFNHQIIALEIKIRNKTKHTNFCQYNRYWSFYFVFYSLVVQLN